MLKSLELLYNYSQRHLISNFVGHIKNRPIFLSCPHYLGLDGHKFLRKCSNLKCYKDKDPSPYFFNAEVQKLLQNLTGFNIEIIFEGKEKEFHNVQEKYKFLTKEDYEENVQSSIDEAKKLLQMPPVVKEREPITEVLSHDPAMKGALTGKLVITDISINESDRNRIIVVREEDGTLRQANWEERDRMNCIYNPRPGKFYKTPPAFEEPNLRDTLNREEYVFLLDFACAQFEPDDPQYHQVAIDAYEHIYKNSNYDKLYSTRHFGPMCFYFAWKRKIDYLLLQYIQKETLQEAVDLIRLYYIINNEEKLSLLEETEGHVNCIEKYVSEDGMMKAPIELALQAYEERLREREALEKIVKASHGI